MVDHSIWSGLRYWETLLQSAVTLQHAALILECGAVVSVSGLHRYYWSLSTECVLIQKSVLMSSPNSQDVKEDPARSDRGTSSTPSPQ